MGKFSRILYNSKRNRNRDSNPERGNRTTKLINSEIHKIINKYK